MMAQALQIDTLAFSEKLQAAGADVLLAKAIVEGISSVDTSTLATKEELRNVEAALKLDLRNVETALKLDLRNVETALKLEIATSANTIITRLGAIIAVMLGIVGALQLFA
jgi:hypothetical protein